MTEREERTLLAPKIELKSLLNRFAVFNIVPLFEWAGCPPVFILLFYQKLIKKCNREFVKNQFFYLKDRLLELYFYYGKNYLWLKN